MQEKLGPKDRISISKYRYKIAQERLRATRLLLLSAQGFKRGY